MSPFAWRAVHQGVPVVFVLYAVALLAVAAAATATRAGTPDDRLFLAGLAVASWLAGISWGVGANR